MRSELIHTSKIEVFAKMVNYFQPLPIFPNMSILDVWQAKDLKSLVVRQLVRRIVYTMFIINPLHFTCGEREIWSNIKKSQNIMTMIVASKILLSHFSV